MPAIGLPWLKAKIDTGARTSSLHAEDVVERPVSASTIRLRELKSCGCLGVSIVPRRAEKPRTTFARARNLCRAQRGASRAMSTLLYGVAPRDPVTPMSGSSDQMRDRQWGCHSGFHPEVAIQTPSTKTTS